jgi:hypothetical protein
MKKVPENVPLAFWDYSDRSATIGSTRAERRAGNQEASPATPISNGHDLEARHIEGIDAVQRTSHQAAQPRDSNQVDGDAD